LKVVGVIPVRYDSRRFPGKALFEIAGKTVIEHVYRRVLKCSRLTEVIIATDDTRIRDCARDFGAEVFFSRTRHSCGTERIAEAMAERKADIVVNIQGDEVVIKPRTITAAIDAVMSDGETDCGTACFRIDDEDEFNDPNLVKVVLDRNRYALYFSRSPIPHTAVVSEHSAPRYGHVGIYAFQPDALKLFASTKPTSLERTESLEQLRMLETGMRIKVSLTKTKNMSLNSRQDIPIIERLILG